MSFPTVRARTETALTTAGTTITINFGTNNAGDLCIAFIGLNDTAQAITTTESFTNLTNASATFHIIYKVLAGTEGTSTTVTVPSSTKAAVLAYTINTGTFLTTQAPEFSTVATGTSTAPNSGSLSPTGGAKDYFWISAFRQNGEEADDDTWCSAAPSSPGTFTDLLQKTSGTVSTASTNGSVASAEYTSNASSMDPGAFTVAQSLAWRAYTVAVHPLYSTLSSTFTANAVLKATRAGTFTADAIEKKTITPAGWTADAVRLKTASATLTANASITGFLANAAIEGWGDYSETWSNLWGTPPVTGNFSANAVIKATITPAGGKKADAVLFKNSGTKTFTANAIVKRTMPIAGATFTANAIVRRTFTPTLTVNAVLKRTQTGATTVNAVTAKTASSTFAANAVIKRTQLGSFPSDAIRLRTQTATFTANAVIFSNSGTKTFAADATVWRTFEPTFAANAVIKREQTGSFAANAVLKRTQNPTSTVDAIRKRTFYFGSGPDPR